jgi:hypothetical protein
MYAKQNFYLREELKKLTDELAIAKKFIKSQKEYYEQIINKNK